MRKILMLLIIAISIVLAGCSDKMPQEISIIKPIENKISKQDNYTLDCRTINYTSIIIGGELIKETYISVKEGHERDTLYIEGNSAKFFGADYEVLQDDSSTLIIMRIYPPSGLTEIVTINKESGIGFDTKTLASGLSTRPNTDTYVLSCTEI